MKEPNGKLKLVYWLAGLLVAILFATSGYMVSRVTKQEQAMDAHVIWSRERSVEFESRLTETETHYEHIREALDRIEAKLNE